MFIIGGEIEIVHAEGTDIGKQDEMVLLGYNREYRVMALTQVKLLVINFTTHYHVCDDIQAERMEEHPVCKVSVQYVGNETGHASFCGIGHVLHGTGGVL